MPRIEITVGRGGKTVMDVKNAQGKACTKLTERVSVNMGLTPLTEELKPEYHVEVAETTVREYA